MTTLETPSTPPTSEVARAIQLREVMSELQRVIVGQERVLERVLVALSLIHI